MTYFGKGIYTLTVAAKILKMDQNKMRRWIKGYTYYKNMECHLREPLFKPEFGYDPNDTIISFLDIIELLFINTFIGYGVPPQRIRKVAVAASHSLNTSHPFAIRKMFTDGKSIFAEIAQKDKDKSLLDLLTKQYQFPAIIKPTLYECIDFNSYDFAQRWWPLGKQEDIVLDPSRNMGQPILNKYNVRTDLIFELYKTNRSIEEISDWYELDPNSVKSAISFESGLAA
jgi:uncharacterized protein (DUF433 family)